MFNGAPFIKNTIGSVLNQFDNDLEIIVSIDQSDDDSASLVSTFNDPRLKIFCQNQRLGMTDNYKFLITKARGEWLTIIGQDDALVPFATNRLRLIATLFPRHEILTSRRSFAFWPDTDGLFGRYSFIYPIDTRKPRLVSSSKFLKKSISGFREYSEGPQLYTGSFVKRSLVERITEVNGGSFYNYLIPDVSSAINLLTNTSEYIFSPLPLFIVGTSSHSTGIAIGQSISSSRSFSNDSITNFFTSSKKEIDIPGDGIFTSFSWYMYEAFVKTNKLSQTKGSDNSDARVIHSALAALKYESKNNKLYTTVQKIRFLQLVNQFEINQIELEFRQIILRIRGLTRMIQKYLYGLFLFMSGRLILSTEHNQKSFSISQLCEMLTLNKHLRQFLDH